MEDDEINENEKDYDSNTSKYVGFLHMSFLQDLKSGKAEENEEIYIDVD